MDKKSKILLWVIILSILISVGYTFYKTIILGDFEVVNIPASSEDLTASSNSEVIGDGLISE